MAAICDVAAATDVSVAALLIDEAVGAADAVAADDDEDAAAAAVVPVKLSSIGSAIGSSVFMMLKH